MKYSYKSREHEKSDKEQLVSLHNALNAAATRLRLDDCRLWTIRGRGSNYISTWGDGRSWLIYVSLDGRPQAWTYAKRRLAAVGCRVTQNGDDEGCLRLPLLPDPDGAEVIREVVGIRLRQPPPKGPPPPFLRPLTLP